MPDWDLPSVPKEAKQQRTGPISRKGADGASDATSNMGLTSELFEADTGILVLSALCDCLKSNRENQAASSDFFLLDKEGPIAVALLDRNKAYDKAIKIFKAGEQEKLQKDPKYVMLKHAYGSPYLHIYREMLKIGAEFFVSGLGKTMQEANIKAKALEKELDRVGGLTTRKAEVGIRMCSIQECHRGSPQAKFRLKVDQCTSIDESTFYMQDIFTEILQGAAAAELRTTPAPPSDKERRLRKILSDRRAEAARRRR